MALCSCRVLYRWWLRRPQVYWCLLGMVDTKQQQRKITTPRCRLTTQRQYTQNLLTTPRPPSSTQLKLQSNTRKLTLPRATTPKPPSITLPRETSPKRLSITLQPTLLQLTILMISTILFLGSYCTEAQVYYTTKAVEYYTEAPKYYNATYTAPAQHTEALEYCYTTEAL